MSEDCFPFFQAMQGDSASGLNLDLQVSNKAVNILLQRIKKALYMISVCCGMVTGDGKRHEDATCFFKKLSSLHGREIIGLVFIAVHSEVGKADPRNTGNGIGICWRRCLRLTEHAVIVPKLRLVLQICLMKL